MSTLLESVRSCLRLHTNVFDDEIAALISAAKADMTLCGVVKQKDGDPLIEQAIKLYAKANFGHEEGREKWGEAYEAMKSAMALSLLYREP